MNRDTAYEPYKSFLSESSSFEKQVQKLIKKDGYAMFNDGQGGLLSVTDIDDGVGYGMTNTDDDEYVELDGKSQRWFLEGTVAGDVAGSGQGFSNSPVTKKKDTEEDEEDNLEDQDSIKEKTLSCDEMNTYLKSFQYNLPKSSSKLKDAIDEVLDLLDTDGSC